MQHIQLIQQRVQEEINSLKFSPQPAELYQPIEYILGLGGKRMRPTLLLLGCALFKGDVEKAMKAALGIEVFHNFTLLHDDIMDKAPLRRSKPTVHEKWNTNIAILSGDTMYVMAYEMMMQVEDQHLRKVLEVFNYTGIKVCEGQQLDMNYESRSNVSISEYIYMIGLKTAELLAASLKIGAIIAGASEDDAQHLYHFGRNIGIAFQLQDDILDVYGDPEIFGKQVGGDIVSNKKTFLLLKAFELANAYSKEELANWISAGAENSITEKVAAVTGIYNFLGVKKLAEKEMNKYFEIGISHLEKIVTTDPAINEGKVLLKAFAESLMVRKI